MWSRDSFTALDWLVMARSVLCSPHREVKPSIRPPPSTNRSRRHERDIARFWAPAEMYSSCCRLEAARYMTRMLFRLGSRESEDRRLHLLRGECTLFAVCLNVVDLVFLFFARDATRISQRFAQAQSLLIHQTKATTFTTDIMTESSSSTHQLHSKYV